jgi:hypothetical protein
VIFARFRNGLVVSRLRVVAEVFRVVFFAIYSQVCLCLHRLATPEGKVRKTPRRTPRRFHCMARGGITPL